MSRVLESGDERQSEALDSQILGARPDLPRFSHSNPMASLYDAAFRRLYRLFRIFDQCLVQVLHNQRELEISYMFRCASSLSTGYNCTYIKHIRFQAVS